MVKCFYKIHSEEISNVKKEKDNGDNQNNFDDTDVVFDNGILM